MRVRGIEPLFAVLETAVFNPLYDTPYYYTFYTPGRNRTPIFALSARNSETIEIQVLTLYSATGNRTQIP